MIITINSRDQTSKRRDIRLAVSSSTTACIVSAGTFRHADVEYELLDEAVWEMTPSSPEKVWVCGYLVKDRSAGSVHVLVDDVEAGEEGYVFNKDSPYELFHILFRFVVPAMSVDLDEIECTVDHMFPAPAPEIEPEED